jgi:hypothetical protein
MQCSKPGFYYTFKRMKGCNAHLAREKSKSDSIAELTSLVTSLAETENFTLNDVQNATPVIRTVKSCTLTARRGSTDAGANTTETTNVTDEKIVYCSRESGGNGGDRVSRGCIFY